MPQGTIPRGEAFFEPTLSGRWGAARLAAATRAPVIPVGVWGTERVWPRSERLPNVLSLLNPPTIRVSVGPAVKGLKGESLDADTKRIMKAISAQLPAEAKQKRVPTECTLSLSELAETLCGDSPEVEYESALVGKVINDYLRALSERDMCLFVSRYFCSDPIGDIAEKCGMSESGVKKALARLREGLREKLEKEGIKL
jgi:hypothetical protein